MNEAFWFSTFNEWFCIELGKRVPHAAGKDTSRWTNVPALLEDRPTPMPWREYWIASMAWNAEDGRKISTKWTDETQAILGDDLSALQDLVISGDVTTARYQAQKMEQMAPKDGEEKKPIAELEKSTLHFAVLTGQPVMVQMLLQEGFMPNIDRPDVVTGFTPVHLAVFTQNASVLRVLLNAGARIDVLDQFGARPVNYARMLQYIPDTADIERRQTKIKVYNRDTGAIDKWDIPSLEKAFNIEFCPRWIVTSDYMEELLLSGFKVENPDEEFRKKYLKAITSSSGDENIIISKISEEVGWGAFAARPIAAGEYIIRYGGLIEKSKSVKDRSYCIQSGIQGVILNAQRFRNLAAFINHSQHPNAESQCIFHCGVEHAVIIATQDIALGQQILIDYADAYFRKDPNVKYVDMSGGPVGEFPGYLPTSAIST